MRQARQGRTGQLPRETFGRKGNSHGLVQWHNYTILQRGYYCDGSVEGGLEGGADIGVVIGTPITSVSAGKVVGAGFHLPGNWVVTVRGPVSFFNGQTMDLYYQHMSNKTVNVGDSVSVGQTLGHSGALTVIEFGINPGNWPGNNGGWGGAWGTLPHPGRSINPDKSGFLASLRKGGGTVDPNDICTACGKKGSPAYQTCLNQIAINHTIPSCAQAAYNAAVQKNLVQPIKQALGVTCESIFGTGSPVCTYLNDPIRIIKIAVGLGLIALAIFLLVTPEAYPVAEQISRGASKVGRGVKSYAKAGASIGKGLS